MQLESCSNLVGVLREVPKEAAIAIADHNRFIYYQPGEGIDIKLKHGEELREGRVSLQALMLKQKTSALVDERLFGVSYFGTSYPIFNNDHIEGVITVIYPPEIHSKNQQPFLIGRKDDLWVPVPHSDIIYISAENGKTCIHTKGGSYQNKYTLTELEYRLPREYFLRTHRSFIINLKAIEEIHPHFHSTFLLVLKDGKRSKIPVSQTLAAEFRSKLGF